jgi:phytoene dehydrogenase-like protein
MQQPYDAIIVGGGLAGLTTAVKLARAGRRVRLFDKSGHFGGRAITQQKQGFAFNLGPHALNANGAARRVLDELHIQWQGRRPAVTGGYALVKGQRETLPAGALSLLTTGMFKLSEKWEAVQWLGKLSKLEVTEWQGVSVHDWLNSEIDHLAVRQLLAALIRVSSYANDPLRHSAGAAIEQVQLVINSGVLYLDGGWQTLIDGLRQAASEAGVVLDVSLRVESVLAENGQIVGVVLANGERCAARNVVLATDPQTAATLSAAVAPVAWQQTLRELLPVKAACLDVALTRLPKPETTFVLGIDTPIYFSVHSATAKLAPADGALIHVAKYLPTGESVDAHAVAAELEHALDLLQPGWRECLVERRFMPELTVSNALVTAKQNGLAGRPSVVVPDVHGLFVASDWVGDEGQLADASAASAIKAAQLILQTDARQAAAR